MQTQTTEPIFANDTQDDQRDESRNNKIKNLVADVLDMRPYYDQRLSNDIFRVLNTGEAIVSTIKHSGLRCRAFELNLTKSTMIELLDAELKIRREHKSQSKEEIWKSTNALMKSMFKVEEKIELQEGEEVKYCNFEKAWIANMKIDDGYGGWTWIRLGSFKSRKEGLKKIKLSR